MDVKRQYFAAFVSLIFTVCYGACEGFSSILLSQLQTPDSPIPISDEEASWIASVFFLPSALGSLTVGILMEIYGRRRTVQLGYVPMLLGWVVISQADTTLMICTGRFINGFAVGMEAAAVVYISEIVVSPAHRSVMLSLLSPTFYVGVATSYGVGYFVHWRQHAIFMGLLAVLGILLMTTVPETPPWLLGQQRLKKAAKSLRWLLHKCSDADVDVELTKLRMAEAANATQTNGCGCSLLGSMAATTTWKPFAIVVTFVCLQQFSGYKVLLFYSVSFYASMGATQIDSYLSSLIPALLTVASSLVFAAVINAVSRKMLMTASASGVCALSAVAAAHLYWWHNQPTKPIAWLPVACVWLVVAFGTIGLNTLTWVMAGELFATRVRGPMVGLTWSISYILMFATVKIYPSLVVAVRVDGVLAIFSVVAFIAILCSIFVLPETGGKNAATNPTNMPAQT